MRSSLLLTLPLVFHAWGCSTSDGTGSMSSAGTATTAGAAGLGTGGSSAGSPSGGAGAGGSATAGAASGGGGASGSPGAGAGGVAVGGAGGVGGGLGAGAGGGAAGGAPPAGCAAVTGAKFCEDWDKQAMGSKPTGDFSVDGGIVVDNTKAFSGTQSLHWQKIGKPASGGATKIEFTKQFPLASNDLHGRVMVWMDKVPQSNDHWNFITSRNSGNTEWSIGGQYGKFELVCDPPDNGLDSKTPFPGGKWACMQWEFKYPGPNQDTTFVTKVDGVSVDQGEFTGKNSKGEKWVAGEWGNLTFGWEIFGSSDVDVEFWLDDLAFGEQVIPCPAAK